nr:hypothetical protein Iba_scaffold56426CG0010 [Ipomoea batatas]GME12294.1 hypothetical protein Iba_scaffold13539CG0020 [Ipomoea batatas]
MTGSLINSRDIGQRKSSGITGALRLCFVHAWPVLLDDLSLEESMSGLSICTKSLIFLNSMDIFSILCPGSPPEAETISCKVSDSCIRSSIPLSCNLSTNLLNTAGSVAALLLFS